MKSFKSWLFEKTGGAKAGSLEIRSTKVDAAVAYAKMVLGSKYEEIQNFSRNYKFAKVQTSKGWTRRKDMPVITSRDVHEFQNRLQQGFIDWKKPFALGTNPNKPFPTGLSGEAAKEWLQNGLAKNDGSSSDDRVRVMSRRIPVSKLKPIQKQIYVDKALTSLTHSTLNATKNFLSTRTLYITSSDNYIIDGHHRYLAGMLIDPSMKVQTIAIDLPIRILLPLALAYGDAIGNRRNA